MFLSSNDGAEFGGSIYQKVSNKLETAVNLAWTAGSNSTRFGIAAKYQLDKDASISVSTMAEPSSVREAKEMCVTWYWLTVVLLFLCVCVIVVGFPLSTG